MLTSTQLDVSLRNVLVGEGGSGGSTPYTKWMTLLEKLLYGVYYNNSCWYNDPFTLYHVHDPNSETPLLTLF